MQTKLLKPMKGRTELVIAALAVVASIGVGSAVFAQDSPAKPATPQATDKMGMDAGGSGMKDMGMGADGNGTMGMMSGMQKMKCCGQGREWAIPIMA